MYILKISGRQKDQVERHDFCLITIFSIHSPFLLPSFFSRKREKGKRITRGQKSYLSAQSDKNKSDLDLV